MKQLSLAALVAFVALALFAQSDARLTVHTLVREDIFAGFMANDMARFAKGEALLLQLEKERPADLGTIRAWQGDIAMFRAVLAYEAGKTAEGDKLYTLAAQLHDEAVKLAPADGGVWAVTGAGAALFADRLPAAQRAKAWARAYELYQKIAAQQMQFVAQLPPHLQGELLAGVVMSAQRTGHQEEFTAALDKMIQVTAKTPYGRSAIAWKERPEIVAKTSLMCKNCHDDGRLEARKTALGAAK